MTELSVKRGDVGVEFTDTLTAAGQPIAGGIADATVTFLMRALGAATALVAADADILDGTACTVRYRTIADDLAVRGVYEQEWQVELDSGEIMTFPSDGYNIIRVLDDLGPAPGS